MSIHEFEFEAFQDHFTPVGEEFGDWPGMSAELRVKWHAAEPDVGIFEKQPEVVSMTFWLDSDTFTDEDAFAAAVYAAIGEEIEETAEAVTKAIRDQVNEWESELEDDS